MSDRFYAVTFTSGHFDAVEPCDTDAEAQAYVSGFHDGSQRFGGDAVGFVIPGDDVELQEYASGHGHAYADAREALRRAGAGE